MHRRLLRPVDTKFGPDNMVNLVLFWPDRALKLVFFNEGAVSCGSLNAHLMRGLFDVFKE